jgi:hypothetical protein
MQLNWCFKGISEHSGFSDAEALAVLSDTGILSAWMFANRAVPLKQANIDFQNVLSAQALDDHVNSYVTVATDTPYISLSAGCIEYSGAGSLPRRIPAFRTALDFATRGGNTSGYVFRCWVITGLKPTPELPGSAEEVRDLNLFARMYTFHEEGEVAAKLFVPRRQVQWVMKFGSNNTPTQAAWTVGGRVNDAFYNVDFVHPDRASNVIGTL